MSIKLSAQSKYYLYTGFTQLRFSRIINILLIVQFLNYNLVQFSILQSIFLFSQFSSEIPSGILSDFFQKKRVILLGIILLIISPILMLSLIYTSKKLGFFILILAFIIEGIGNAFLSGADDALFFELLRFDGVIEDSYAKVRGRVQLIAALSAGLATFIGGLLYEYSKALPYVAQSFVLILAALIIIFIPEKVQNIDNSIDLTEEKNKQFSILKNLSVFRQMLKAPNIFFMFVFTAFTVAIVNALFSVLPDYVSKLGFSSSSNGLIFMLYGLVGGLVATQTYRLVKYGIKLLCTIVVLIVAVGTYLQLQSNSYIFLVGIGLLYIVVDIIDPIVMEMLNLWVKDKSRATFISGLSFSITLVTMVINPVIGLSVQNVGVVLTLLLTSIFLIVMIILSYKFISKKG